MDHKANKDKPKVIVIGLDGATWTNLKPWMDEGLLPNLKHLVDNGVSGELESTIPPHSAAAWTSFMTGVNPGKHGIFGFVKPFRDKQYKTEIVSSRDIKTETIFKTLSDYNKTSGVINLPITYPAFQIKGFMVSCGFTTPSVNCKFTYPEDLFEKIGIEKENYILDVNWLDYPEDKKDRFFEDLIKCEEKREEISFNLMDKHEWDLFVTVFTGIDRLSHFCWHYIDKTHSKYNFSESQKMMPNIKKYYRKIDEIIGEFVKRLGKNTSLFIVSDHGFGPREKKIAFHKILEENKLLQYRNKTLINKFSKYFHQISGILHQKLAIYRKIKANVFSIYRLIKRDSLKKYISEKNLSKEFRGDVRSGYWKKINWKKTLCYSGYTANTIYLNIKNREPEGIINSSQEYQKTMAKVINLLNNIYEPEKRRNLQVNVYKKDDIYQGPYSQYGCDLYLDAEEESYLFRIGVQFKDVFDESGGAGNHKKNGILICYGNNFKKTHHIENAQIIDIAPNILYFLGIPVSEDMDGKVLEAAINEDFLNKNPIERKKSESQSGKSVKRDDIYGKEDHTVVEKRLANLGYI